MSTRAADRLQPRDDLRALAGYHSPQIDVPVRLNTNESPFPPPASFVDDWIDSLRALPFHRYPDRNATDLREALGAALDQSPERLLCANGSNEVLQTILLTYGGPGRPALVFEPTYALHAHISRITGTEVIEGERLDDFSFDAGSIGGLLDRTGARIVFLCSPNNPTGTTETLDTIATVAETVASRGALLVVDEAYGEFADESALDLVDDGLPLLVVRTYSKVWSMAALRLGFGVGPTWAIAELDKVLLPYALSAPTQLAGVRALDYRAEMADRVETLVAERERLQAVLAAIPGVTAFPSGANFVLVRVEPDEASPDAARPAAGRALWQALLDRGVLVRDFSHWPRVEGCLRVTVGTSSENDAFLTALRDATPEVITT